MAENSKAVLKIDYPDYTPSQDFSLWFSGWREKLRMACNLASDEEEELQEEVVKFISGKLASGPALTTYNNFPEATKTVPVPGDLPMLPSGLSNLTFPFIKHIRSAFGAIS